MNTNSILSLIGISILGLLGTFRPAPSNKDDGMFSSMFGQTQAKSSFEAEVKEAVESTQSRISNLESSLGQLPTRDDLNKFASSQSSFDRDTCKCNCPTAEEIAEAVARRLNIPTTDAIAEAVLAKIEGRFTVTTAKTNSTTGITNRTSNKINVSGIELEPGEELVAINGVPVNSTSQPVYAMQNTRTRILNAPVRSAPIYYGNGCANGQCAPMSFGSRFFSGGCANGQCGR